MTDQERQLLEELAGRIQKAPATPTDRDADDLIRRSIGTRPDALYILTQTVLIQEMALNQAKQQLDDLRRQQPSQPFLGNTPPPRQQPGTGYRASSYQTGYMAPPPPPLPQYAQPQYAPPAYPQPQPSGFSGFLHNAAQTAAGIVAGEVAFSAISSLFGRHDSFYGGGGFLGGGGGNMISPGSETIINNNTYYEGDRDRDHEDRRSADTDPHRDDSTDNSTDATTDTTTDDTPDDSSSYDDGSDSSDV